MNAGAISAATDKPSSVIDLDSVESPVLNAGIAHWRKLAVTRPFPARTDLVPRDIQTLLRNTVLVRVVDQGSDYEYRIVGDAHVLAHGFSMQGRRVSQIDAHAPGYGETLKRLYGSVVTRRTGYALKGWLARGGALKQYIYTESVFLPLGPDPDVVDHILNFAVYIPHDAK